MRRLVGRAGLSGRVHVDGAAPAAWLRAAGFPGSRGAYGPLHEQARIFTCVCAQRCTTLEDVRLRACRYSRLAHASACPAPLPAHPRLCAPPVRPVHASSRPCARAPSHRLLFVCQPAPDECDVRVLLALCRGTTHTPSNLGYSRGNSGLSGTGAWRLFVEHLRKGGLPALRTLQPFLY